MKLIIELDEKRYEEIKQIANAQLELKNKTEAQIIANGTPYNPTGDCISREALKEKLKERYYNDGLNIVTAIELIDKAPPVPQVTVFAENADEKAVADMKAELQNVIDAKPNEQIAWEQGYEAGLAQGKHDRPQGEWARHDEWVGGEYVGGFYHVNCPCEDGLYSKWRTNFCPNCGADMRTKGDTE